MPNFSSTLTMNTTNPKQPYASHSAKPAAYTGCWMEISVFDAFPPHIHMLLFPGPPRPVQHGENSDGFAKSTKSTVGKSPVQSACGTPANVSPARSSQAIVSPPSSGDQQTAAAAAASSLPLLSSTVNSLLSSSVIFLPPPTAKLHHKFKLRFELFSAESPRACENFYRLCNGQGEKCGDFPTVSYQGQRDIPLTYKGTFFHKIMPGFISQGGDVTRLLDGGCNQFSVFGRPFCDENLKRTHGRNLASVDCKESTSAQQKGAAAGGALKEKNDDGTTPPWGLLSMANNGPNSNGTQFFIVTTDQSTKAAKSLDGRHVCFGRVVEGLQEFLSEVAGFGDLQGTPQRYAAVTNCGQE